MVLLIIITVITKKVVILENNKTIKAITFSQLVQASSEELFQNSKSFQIIKF